MPVSLRVLLERLTPLTRDRIVATLGHQDTCIPTSRILQAVLERFGFQATPVAAEVIACNPMYAQMVKSFDGRDPSAEEVKAWQDRGAFAVRISPEMATAGVPISGTGWDGHLVLRVEDIVLDGSIEMCSRPAKAIILPKLLGIPVDRMWDAGRRDARQLLVNGCEVSYKKLNDESWQTASYWTEPFERRLSFIADEIASRVNNQA
jgi:hypothetical protein